MTSRLTLAAIFFSVLSTAALVWSAEANAATPAATVHHVQLERVTITAPRLAA